VHAVPAEWLTLDLYAELGVSRTASSEQVRTAYRDLAQRFHPDRQPGDALAEDRFKRISTAYKVLADPLARASYDRLHLAGPRPVPVRPAPAHRVPTSYRSAPARRGSKDSAGPPAGSDPTPPAPRDEASTLAGLAVLVTVGAVLLAAAVVIAVFVIGPDCDVPRELSRLGCPPAP
jgi:curved DNA-binding protein CbpA